MFALLMFFTWVLWQLSACCCLLSAALWLTREIFRVLIRSGDLGGRVSILWRL